MPSPRMNHNARMAFMYTYKEAQIQASDWTNPIGISRIYLISRPFVDSCFMECEKEYKCTEIGVNFEFHQLSIQPYWLKEDWDFGDNDFNILLTIIQIARFSAMHICMNRFIKYPAELSNFKRLCQVLKDKHELERLSVEPMPNQLELILELLPDKIHKIDYCQINFPLYKKLKAPIHYLNVRKRGRFTNYNLALKTPANTIEFNGHWTCNLYHLAQCAPYTQNPYLKTLIIPVWADETQHFDKDHDKWKREVMPAYKTNLEYIKQINENAKLKSKDSINYYIDGVKFKSAFNFHKNVLQRVHALVDIALEMNIEIELNELYFTRERSQTCSKRSCRRFGKTLGMKRTNDSISGKYEYRQSKFTISYSHDCFD